MLQECLLRDWDVIGRAWAARSIGFEKCPRRIVLFHHANIDLIRPPVERIHNTSRCADECKDSFILCLDDMEQLVGASSVLLPGFSSLLTCLLMTGIGSTTQPNFVIRYENEDDIGLQYGILNIPYFCIARHVGI